MSDEQRTPPAPAPRQDRRRLQEVFGDVLPDTTTDERSGDGRAGTDADSDRWLRDQVPPHHG